MPYKDPAKNAECKKLWRKNNKHKEQAYCKANKVKIDARKKAWREANQDRWKTRRREQTLRRYGITPAIYLDMLMNQESCCALCGTSPEERLVVDHDHTTGKVRALICRYCNSGLGMLRDNPILIRRCADYIDRHSKPSPNK